MFPNLETKSTPQISWEQRLLKNGGKSKGALKPEYQELKFTLHRKLVDKINLEALATIDNQRVRSEVRQALISLIDSEPTLLSSLEKQQICDEVLDEVFGLGPLEPLLQDPTISDILVNTHKQVYIERKGLLELTTVSFRDNQHLLRIIDKIVSQVGRRVDESTPMVDARLSDGSRVNAIIPPLAVDGPCLSIRRFGRDPLTADDLLQNNSLTPSMLELLRCCVKARLNILVSGGTGAGKTTFLNVLSSYISNRERIVTVEDAAELQLHQDHVVRLETRPANIEGKGAVQQRQLVINSLRMRPDRIIVGEVRGEEALDMLQAMNTGHDGSLTTIHANTPRDALSRLETMVAMGSLNIPENALRRQIASAIDVVVQVSRLSDGTRKVISLAEITGMEGDVVSMQDIFIFRKRGIRDNGEVLGEFIPTGIRPKFAEKLLVSGVQLPGSMFETTHLLGV
jgi:pilus assembly protein CpaF